MLGAGGLRCGFARFSGDTGRIIRDYAASILAHINTGDFSSALVVDDVLSLVCARRRCSR